MSEAIINKVANSGLITIDLEKYAPNNEVAVFDLKDHLFMGMILKEKEYREGLKNFDWQPFKEKNAAIICSVDAIIPVWAYMLAASYLQEVAHEVYVGSVEEMGKHIFLKNLSAIDINNYADQRIVVKGCGDRQIESFAYAEITRLLKPVAKSIMYGEPCSTVPVYKKK
jgi:hypothetical protein